MPSLNSVEKTLQFTPLLKGSDAISKDFRRRGFSLYKFSLFVHDLIMINLAFGLSTWITGLSIFILGDLIQSLILLILSLIILSFFPTFNLYNYHHIFFQKSHSNNLVKAFGWSLPALGIVVFLFAYPQTLQGNSSVWLIFIFAIGLLIISRFLWDHILNILRSVGISFLATGLIAIISPEEGPMVMTNWMAIPMGFCLAAGIVFMSRNFMVQVVFNKWMRRRFRQQIAIVGSNQEAKMITNHIIGQDAPFWVSGIVADQEIKFLDTIELKDSLGELKDLPTIADEKKIDQIIVTDENINQRVLISLLDYCTSEGLTVWFPPKLLPIIDMKLYIDNFCGIPMIRLCSQKHSWVFNKLKHGFDALITLPLFLLLLPVFIILGVIIKLNSKGPVFYRANAIGREGEEFTMFKFRSMKVEDSNDIHKDYVTKLIKGDITYDGKEDQVFKVEDDPRITFIGRILRKFSLDELPQILNVLKGDMSLVGPRPCLPYEYEVYKDWHKKRQFVRPGITGLWQVAGRSAVTFEDMILLDLYYIYNRSLLMDMNIMYETIFVVLGKRGAH
ncbi:MAG: exopolysaccharide biosynthesis polyprenyl glycosylphosphotransferase [Deltaproteobacteria bacterium]|nr:exopolysaccharide biosynthesis polyprenyl glycosylphosphotransferase [Deltaproteobacteria bacterium]